MQVKKKKKTHPCLSAGVRAPLREQVSPGLQAPYELGRTLQVSGGYVSLHLLRSPGKALQLALIKLNRCQDFLRSFEESFLNIRGTGEESKGWGREAGQF